MIIVGYPGIGKSTLASKYPGGKYIDLESSNFKELKSHEEDLILNSGRRSTVIPGWAIIYVRIALDLSRSGYHVFISSHESVQRALLEQINHEDHVFVVYPALSLKTDWLRRLRERYQYTSYTEEYIERGKKALLRAIDNYEEDIKKLHNSSFDEIVINSMDYGLEELIFGDQKN